MITSLVTKLKQETQLRWNGIYNYKPNIKIHLDLGNYIIKTAESHHELIECLRLRRDVFINEFKGENNVGLDFDKYDQYFDHLVIYSKEEKKIVGNYRLSCVNKFNHSYTGQEFDLTLLRLERGPYLELGRACIHKNYRKGSIITLLWRGIAEYMNASNASLLYGCSSVKVFTAKEAALLYRYFFEKEMVSKEIYCPPQPDFKNDFYDFWTDQYRNGLTETQTQQAELLIPSLVKTYLKIGAKIASEPAFDYDFKCIDLFTVLRKKDLENSLVQKFKIQKN